MFIETYNFTKKLYKDEYFQLVNIPDAIKEIIKWFKKNRFAFYHFEAPQKDYYNKIEIQGEIVTKTMPGSYVLNFAYNFEKIHNFLEVSICKNDDTGGKIEWLVGFDDMKEKRKGTVEVENYNFDGLKKVVVDFKKMVEKIGKFKELEIWYGRYTGFSAKDVQEKIGGQLSFQTDIGPIEESIWYSKAYSLIKEYGEEQILNNLKNFVSTFKWIRTEEEALQYALKLHIARIFENHKWVCYKEFQEYSKIQPQKSNELKNNTDKKSKNFLEQIKDLKKQLNISEKSQDFKVNLNDLLSITRSENNGNAK